MNVRMQHRFFQNFCRLLHELSYKSQSDNAWRSKNKCGALGWPCFNQSWHHWMFRMWVKQLLKKIVNVPELCVFFSWNASSMILKNYGEALQQQLQEQAELQLQLQQHLEQEIYPWLAWVSKKNIIRIKKKSLGSKKNIRINKIWRIVSL